MVQRGLDDVWHLAHFAQHRRAGAPQIVAVHPAVSLAWGRVQRLSRSQLLNGAPVDVANMSAPVQNPGSHVAPAGQGGLLAARQR